jgi:hypothetical protein
MRAGAQALEKSRGTGNWDFMIGVEPELQCQPPLSLTAATRHGPACPGQLVRHVPEGGGADTPGQKGYTTANARSRWHMAPTANTDWT